jgi:hypothetical protein
MGIRGSKKSIKSTLVRVPESAFIYMSIAINGQIHADGMMVILPAFLPERLLDFLRCPVRSHRCC